VRLPDREEPASAREIDEIHPEELELAIVLIARDALRITAEEITLRAARLFGWQRRGSGISRTLQMTVERLVARGMLEQMGSDWLAAAPDC
jgi:hypothetical protein